MKKILLVLLVLGYLPYLFLATSVERLDPKKAAQYDCVASKTQHVKEWVSFGTVYYDFNMKHNKRIVMPYFFLEGDIFYAICGNTTFPIGRTDWLKPGDKMKVRTEVSTVKFFGKTLFSEEGIVSFSNQ